MNESVIKLVEAIRNGDAVATEEAFAATVPLTPDAYRAAHESDLNEWRTAAGLPVKKIHNVKTDLQQLQSQAGIL